MKPIYETTKDFLRISIYPTNQDMGMAAAVEAREVIQKAIRSRGQANIILATGNSQFTFLASLCGLDNLNWARVNIFHVDEYVGIDPNHPASFHKYLHEHIIDIVKPGNFYPVPGVARNMEQACQNYEKMLRDYPADLCALGIGENGHLAFNDPPLARFDDPDWVKVVQLTDSCKLQQVGEGHFKSINEVPREAVTLTIPAVLASRHILAIVPEVRKAEIIFQAMTGPIDPLCPGSILRQAANCHLFLDANSGTKIFHN